MLREFDYDKNESLRRIESRVKTEIEQALNEELDGTEGPDDVTRHRAS
jgi:hypothetical protein